MINKTNIEGRLTKDPELKIIGEGEKARSLVKIMLAVDKGKDKTNFIPVTLWGHNAEYCAKNIRKGYLVSVTGTLESGSFTTKSGEKRHTLDVVADSYHGFNFISKPKQSGDDNSLDDALNTGYNGASSNNFNSCSGNDFSSQFTNMDFNGAF